MKVRIKFEKFGEMRFIGHLDLMRAFQKIIRRSSLPIKFSEGMSPHMIMSFASPLGLGLTSEGEYVDLELTERVPAVEIIDRLNGETVEGVRFIDARQVGELRADNAMALLEEASYRIRYKEGYTAPQNWQKRFSEFLAQEKIEVIKQSKKGEKLVDIKPLIKQVSIQGEAIEMRVSSGSAQNLKPELVMEAFSEFAECQWNPFSIAVCRLEMYGKNAAGEMISLLEFGEEIL